MLVFGLIFAAFANTFCNAQIAYSRILPYDPQYLLRAVPARRSVDTEYQRLQLPISRYFPQVDAQVVPASYLAPKPIAYRLPNGEVYAVPATWSDEETQVRNDEDADYDTYDEYDNEYGPVYARPLSAYPAAEVYGTPQEEAEPPEEQYNDLVVNYLLRNEMTPPMDIRAIPNPHHLERKKHDMAIPNDKVDKQGNDTPDATAPSTTLAPVVKEKVSSKGQTGATSAPASPSSSSVAPPKVAAPLSRVHKSGEEVPSKIQFQHGMWQKFDDDARGQKEFPLYRPFQAANQHREAMATLQHELSRAKNSVNTKDPFPMIEKLMAAQRSKDPLAEQLDDLKFRNM